MDIKKLNLAVEQARKVCNEMNECANKYILQDAIKDMDEVLDFTNLSGTIKVYDIETKTTNDFVRLDGKDRVVMKSKKHGYTSNLLNKVRIIHL